MFVQLIKEFMGRKPGERIHVSEPDANALVVQQLATPVTDDLITPAKMTGLHRQRETARPLKTASRERPRSRLLAIQTPAGQKGHPVWSLKRGDTSAWSASCCLRPTGTNWSR